jgi:hypothetical protein
MRHVLLCALLCLTALPAVGAQAPPRPAPLPPPAQPVLAVRTNEPIAVDGALDEEVWKGSPAVHGLLQQDPQQGNPESQGTEIWVAFDDDAIYVGARLHDSQPDSVVARLARRDNLSGSDAFIVMFDTFRDKRTGYYFGLSAAGTLVDGVLMNDGWDDDSWDGVWSGRARRDAQGWTAELRVPFSQMRFDGGENMVWGVNFERTVSRRNEDDKLVYTPRSQSGFVSRFPELQGLDGIRARRTLELLPYATGKAEYLQHDPSDPYHDGSEYLPAAGLDLRTSLGPKLTLNGTVNPDFGQVEIDPAVVNLSDVESYYQEKRPFFTEGLSVFRCGNNGASDYWGFNWPEPTFFYSRRIGAAPGGEVPEDAAYSDVPLAVRILGAAKITGQPKPGLNFGTLHALTRKETADFQREDGTRGSAAVEPLTYHGVLRGLKSYNKERQGLGFMALETARAFDGTGLNDQFNRNGFAGVIDGWTALDARKTWVASGYLAATRIDGTAARIASVQQSSRHYFQRPDRSDLGVATDATHMSGAAGRVWVNREKGPWLSNSAIGFISPGFENNDLGFLSRTDVINAHAGLGYAWDKPSSWRQRWYVIGAVAQSFNFAGQHTMSEVYLGSNLEQKNALSWDGSVGWSARVLSDRATRGGPAMVSPQGGWGNLYFDTNGKSKLYFYASVSPNWDVEGSHEMPFQLGVTWKPSSSLSLSAGPSFGESVNDAMYVTQTVDPYATATYGGRYVFAQLEQRTVAGEFRMDCSLTPSLSIQLYVQPLVSSGKYTRYRELARPNSYDFFTYGVDGGSTLVTDSLSGDITADPDGAGPAAPIAIGHPDFTYSTVRGNMVLRWEYLPGSTMYLVWTQERTGPDTGGEFNLKPTLNELARTPANNVFMVKVSHHFEL